jgi:hypothetical protein
MEPAIVKMPQFSATSRDVPLELSLCVAMAEILDVAQGILGTTSRL